jgi:hypothetical protein
MRKVIFYGIVLVILGCIAGYFYLYKDHRNIEKEEAFAHIASAALVQEFTSDPEKATQKYLNQTIEVKGLVTEASDSTLMLEGGIFCSFDQVIHLNEKDKNVVVKGRCIGYDELFNEVKLDQCSLTPL